MKFIDKGRNKKCGVIYLHLGFCFPPPLYLSLHAKMMLKRGNQLNILHKRFFWRALKQKRKSETGKRSERKRNLPKMVEKTQIFLDKMKRVGLDS